MMRLYGNIKHTMITVINFGKTKLSKRINKNGEISNCSRKNNYETMVFF